MMFKRFCIGALLAATATVASATPPTVVSLTPGLSFQQYSGPGPTGQGLIDSDVFYYIDEQTGTLGKSYFVFFDPLRATNIDAVLSFEGAITAVYTTRSDLRDSNAEYGIAGNTYGDSVFIGLEPGQDSLSFSGNTLTIDWRSSDPGDHIRVFVAAPPVPEPETVALLAAGLGALGWMSRRRQKRAA